MYSNWRFIGWWSWWWWGWWTGSSITKEITQTSHWLAIGEAVYFDWTDYLKAQADNIDTIWIGIVSAVKDVNTFTLTLSWYISWLSWLVTWDWYYVSDTTPWLLTLTESTIYSNPILQAISSTEWIVQQLRVEEWASVRYLNNEVDWWFANSVYLIDQLIDWWWATT